MIDNKEYQIIPGAVVRSEGTSSWRDGTARAYSLTVNGVKVSVSEHEAEQLIISAARPEDLVYSVNTMKGEPFHDPAWPDWSVKTHYRHFVAGNIYYATREEAERKLLKEIGSRIEKERRLCEMTVKDLEGFAAKVNKGAKA